MVGWLYRTCMTDRPTDHLTIEEAAAALDISREAVRLRIRRGTLTGVRVGGAWYVSLVGRSETAATDRPTDQAGCAVAPRGVTSWFSSCSPRSRFCAD